MYGKKWEEIYQKLSPEEPNLKWHNFNHTDDQFDIFNINQFMHKSFFPLVHKQKYFTYVPNTPLVLITEDKVFPKLLPVLEVYYFMKAISKTPIPESCKIFLIPLSIPKTIQQTEFSKRNINSGVCINHEVIIIWRDEEITKVLCHEMIHMLHLDYLVDEVFLTDLPKKFFNISPLMKCYPNECTTDALAIYIMSFLNSRWKNSNPEHLFKKEVLWTIHQCKKIWNNLSSTDDINTEADIVSYYFLKSLLLCSILTDHETRALLLSDTIFQDPVVPKDVSVLKTKFLSQETINHLETLAQEANYPITPTLKMSKYST